MSRKYNGVVINGKTVHSWTETDSLGNSVTVVKGDFSNSSSPSYSSSVSSEGGSGHYTDSPIKVTLMHLLIKVVGFVLAVFFVIALIWFMGLFF